MLAVVSKRRVAKIMGKRGRLAYVGIDLVNRRAIKFVRSLGDSPRNLGYFESVSQPIVKSMKFCWGRDLGNPTKSSQMCAVKDAVPITLGRRPNFIASVRGSANAGISLEHLGLLGRLDAQTDAFRG